MPWSVVDFLSWVPVRLNVIKVEKKKEKKDKNVSYFAPQREYPQF